MRDKVEDILFKVSTGTGNQMDFVLPNHFSQRQSQLCSTHCTGQADHHLAALIKMRSITFGGVDQCGSIEMSVVMINKLSHRADFF